ncbi:MAG: hypothetical protein HY403_08865, partial [Elusimicrobia bacterium]|nr:hypothetical protein [Elusimicrobiota bacterium]
NLKAALAGATFTGASGITNQAFTATGVNGNIITSASMTASGFFLTSPSGQLKVGYTATSPAGYYSVYAP